jgi:hypothetical protein
MNPPLEFAHPRLTIFHLKLNNDNKGKPGIRQRQAAFGNSIHRAIAGGLRLRVQNLLAADILNLTHGL